jgi:hypothetical protein
MKKGGYAGIFALLFMASCTSIGPRTIDRDRPSRVTFTFLMILFSLVETGGALQAPLITVPVG